MAITVLPRQQSFGSQFGTGLGRGISSGVQNLISMQLQKIEQQRQQEVSQKKQIGISNMLEGLGYSPEQAKLFSSVGLEHPKLLDKLISEGVPTDQPQAGLEALSSMEPAPQEMEPQPEITPTQRPEYEKKEPIKKFRKTMLKLLKRGQISKAQAQVDLKNEGFSAEAIEVILSPALTDNIRLYFLKQTNNNPKAAKKLARQYGFRT